MTITLSENLYMGTATPASGSGGGGVSLDQIIVKSATIPTAGEEYAGAVYQYVGETNSTYTHGYIYECKAVVESDTTSYVWERIDVQPGATRGRFLALWNCVTGLAESNPPTSPYPYGTGDYFIVGTVGTTNYKPSGSSYVIGTASTVVETSDVAVNDTYYYDGTNWNLQKNTETTVDQTYDPTSPKAQSGTAVAQAIEGITIPTVNNATLTITQGGVSKGTFTANAGTDVTIALDAGVSIDNSTITKNASDELQASAVMNARTGTDVLPIWQGTEQQWEDGVGTDWYNWKTNSVLGSWTTSESLPSSRRWASIAYGNDKFVTVANGPGVTDVAYSTNGTQWTSSNMPTNTGRWSSICYGGGKFVAVAGNGGKTNYAAYSTDGIEWTASTLRDSLYWSSVCYGNDKFVAVAGAYSNTQYGAYSTDGIEWHSMELPSSALWYSVAYGNGKFVTVASGSSDKVAYSTDGINWTETTLPSLQSWQSVCYGDGKFVAIPYNGVVGAYSTDGIEWIETEVPSGTWTSMSYGDGKFVAVPYYSYKAIYSSDGINWFESSSMSYQGCASIAYGDGKFVAVMDQSKRSSYAPLTFSSCYTLDSTPTTSSTVYSAPNSTSALTITSVGTGTITLSDNNTYTYTQSGDEVTYQSIGEAHPTWLCNINGVGVKVGTTVIADNTDTSTLQTKANLVTSVDSSSTDSQYPSAKLFYDTVGDIESALNTINSGS